MEDSRIPVTLLTGFLGAGKTTLLNRLLTDEAGERIAVIVNEFGEVGLDHDLMEISTDDVVLLSSGCLCCTVRGELSETITQLLARRTSGEFDFSRIVIETTGLADPGPILQTMLVERAVSDATRVDGVVTVVDAANGPATLDAQFEAVSQVAMADLVILSKTDLIDYDQIIALEARLRGLNATARIVPAVRGKNISDQIWGLSGLKRNVQAANAISWVAPVAAGAGQPKPDPLANLSGFGTSPKPAAQFSPHDARIETASIIIDTPVTDQGFDDWLNDLVRRKGPNLLRVKGIVFLEGIPNPFVFHGVQNVFDPPVLVKDWPEGDQTSRVVIIARDIPQSELQGNLDALAKHTASA
ncbi:CobW family GTP-binding protein [Cognatishimia activa]|uniref:CobW family GTP-binding protein n=1 Tax=Cognatishimia activa TaxID=1715691 RepID=UPI00222F0752|nr:GTP-binding protein [Cognatishimia activa]UZD89607.1 GTP-binding protein [Cognatishimia activa]